MCGIAGVLDRRRSTHGERLAGLAAAMADTLAHRGPDGSGSWADPAHGIGLGHRRLAIVDLSDTGRQPMRSASGRYTITFNGEIYDHVELRLLLEKLGHTFRGTCDTEVLLAAIEEWGLEGALRRCNAMFALALWDSRERRLSLARDRLGEKPLFYGTAGHDIVFGSELKALRRHPDLRPEIDREALSLYLRHTYVPAPHCIYVGCRKLPAGTILTIDADGSGPLPEPVPFWSLRSVVERGVDDPFKGDGRDAADALDELLADAVRLRLQADVSVGAFLSGGVDSSVVVALAQRAGLPEPVRTFTVSMPDLDLDESAEAAAVAGHLGTRHTAVAISAQDALDEVPRLPSHYDEPFSDPSQLPTLLVARAARRHVTVALTGDGGDEVFGGYNRHVFGPQAWQRMRRVPAPVRSRVARGLLGVRPAVFDVVGRGAGRVHPKLRLGNLGDKVHKLAGVLGVPDADAVYLSLCSQWDDPAGLTGVAEPSTMASDPKAWPRGIDAAQRMLYLDTTMALADGMLMKVDRASMAASLETRLPLLDHRIVELAWRLPHSMKVEGGQGKVLLRQVLDRYVPRTLIDRPKMGFDPPIGDWLRGPLREWGDDLLDPSVLGGQGLLDPAPVRARWDAHQRGERNWDYHLWTVLQLQAWLQEL